MTQRLTGASSTHALPELRGSISILVLVGLLPLIPEGCGPPS